MSRPNPNARGAPGTAPVEQHVHDAVGKENAENALSAAKTAKDAGAAKMDCFEEPTAASVERPSAVNRTSSAAAAVSVRPMHVAGPTVDQLTMKQFSNTRARALAKPFSQAALQVVDDANLFFDPEAPFAKDFQHTAAAKTAVIYVKFTDGSLLLIDKYGSTSKWTQRVSYYEEQGVSPERLWTVINYNNVPVAVDRPVCQLYSDFMNVMQTDKQLHPFQTSLFKAIRTDHGESLGLKKETVLQLLESGVQWRKNRQCQLEMLSFQNETYQRVVDQGREIAEAILEAAPKNVPRKVTSLSSWPTACAKAGKLSSKAEIMNCIVESWKDAIDVAAKPDAETAEDAFSTACTPEQKEAGRQVAFETFQEHKVEGGWLHVDTNNCIFRDDPNFDNKPIENVLIEDFGFVTQLVAMDGEIVMLVHGVEVILLHSPLSLAGDSRRVIANILRILREFAVVVLSSVSRIVQGERPLTENIEFGNAINAMFAFQTVLRDFHQDPRTAAAFFRHCMTDAGTNALLENDLPKVKDPLDCDCPVARRAREGKEEQSALASRPLDWDMLFRARALCTKVVPSPGTGQAPHVTDEQMTELCFQIQSLFTDGGVAPDSKACARWKAFLENDIRPNSRLHNRLQQTRQSFLKNSGNQSKGRIGNSVERVQSNSEVLKQCKQERGPNGERPSAPFWIRAKAGKKGETMPQWTTQSTCGTVELEDCPIMVAFAFQGLVENPKERPREGTTKRQRVEQENDLSVVKVLNKKAGKRLKDVTGQHELLLVKLVHKEDAQPNQKPAAMRKRV